MTDEQSIQTWEEIQAQNERWWRQYVDACKEADAEGVMRPWCPPASPLPMWWPLPEAPGE